jgi:hypothetical protein
LGSNYEHFTAKNRGFVSKTLSTAEQTYEGTHNQIETEFGLGNRWQFGGGFSLGVTWFGVSQGVANLGDVTSSGTNLTAEDKKLKDDDLSKAAKSNSIAFTKFTLGGHSKF